MSDATTPAVNGAETEPAHAPLAPSPAPVRELQPQIAVGTCFKIVGLGGVGGPLARYLALFLAHRPEPTRLVLIDGDAFEPKNRERMFFGRTGNKAAVIRDELREHTCGSSVAIAAIEEFLAQGNLANLVHESDIVLLAVDNHATRKLVNDHCARHLRDVCLISGGNDGVGVD